MKTAKILVVEDDSLSKELLKRILESEGYTKILYTSNGIDAVNIQRLEKVDLVLMDISLADQIDGINAAELLDSNVPVIYLTSSTDIETFNRTKSTNSFGFIEKPYSAKIVIESIAKALGSKPL